MSRRTLASTPSRPAPPSPFRSAPRSLAGGIAAAAEPNFPITPRAARHRPARRRGRRAAVARSGAERARRLHRQARATRCGASPAVPEEPVALARAVGHEHGPGAQPAPHLSRARCCSSTSRTAAPACAWARRSAAAPPATASCRRACAPTTSPLDGIASIPFHLIEPFLNEAVIFESNAARQRAAHRRHPGRPRAAHPRRPRLRARRRSAPEREYRIFREPRPLRDPTTKEILGYEAHLRRRLASTRSQGETRTGADGKAEIVPATFTVTSIRQEAGVGDRLRRCRRASTPTTCRTRRPAPIGGQIVSIYGDALTAGQNQIVAINSGAADGIERGHVLALYRDGKVVIDPTETGARTHDQAARRAPRPAVRVPRLRAHVVRADPVGEASRSRPATASAALSCAGADAGRPRQPRMIDRDELAAWLRLARHAGRRPRRGAAPARAPSARRRRVLDASTAARQQLRRRRPRPRRWRPSRRGLRRPSSPPRWHWLDGAGDAASAATCWRSATPRYPPALLETADPPLLLYVAGPARAARAPTRSRSSAAATRRRRAWRTRAPSPRT